MRARFVLAWIVLGTFIVAPVGIVLAGGMGGAHWEKKEMQRAEESTELEVPVAAPTDYVEWLESHEGLETGSLTAPGVEPTVIEGPTEFPEIPEGGFGPGVELAALAYDGGVAKVTTGGTFRAEAEEAAIVDIGPPRILGLLAVRETDGEEPKVLSVLFDRPVFVEEIGFRAPTANADIPGKAYSTGFGMTAELNPEPAVSFEGEKPYRVGFAVRDGKGRRAVGEAEWIPRVVTRH